MNLLLHGAEVHTVKSINGQGVAGWSGTGEEHGHEISERIVVLPAEKESEITMSRVE